MDYLSRFMEEYRAGKVDFSLLPGRYKERLKEVLPPNFTLASVLLHGAWIGISLFFALRISHMGSSPTAALSLAGMAAAILVARFLPVGMVFGGMILLLGMAILPFYIQAGPIGMFGLSSAARAFKTWYGKKLVQKWILGSEDRFLQSLRNYTMEVTATEKADDDTRAFLEQLKIASTPDKDASGEKKEQEEAGPEKSGGPHRTHVDFATAEQYYKRSLEIKEKEFGPDHPDVATILNNMGVLYRGEGDYASAEPLYKRALAIREKALGPDHPEVATSLNNLGVLYSTRENYAAAEPLYKRALSIREKALGPNHADVAVTLNNLAVLYRATSREKEASRLEQRAEKITGVKR